MKYLFFFLILLSFQFGHSQPCSREQLATIPGKFSAGYKGSIDNVTASDLVRERAVLNTIFNKIKASYSPTGCIANCSFVFGKNLYAGSNWKADPYYHSEYILKYICDSQDPNHIKYESEGETATVLTITANVAHWLNTLYAAEIPADDLREYFKMEKRPELVNGFWYMGEFPVYRKNGVKERTWMITYHPDSLPFSYVNRKDYLEMLRRKLLKDIKENPSDIKYTQKYLDNIDRYIASASAADLQETASCMWNQEERFEGFVPEGEQGSFIAVKPNMAYYRKNLPKSAPQFFTVVFKYDDSVPVYKKNMEDLQKAIDFKELRSMLGK